MHLYEHQIATNASQQIRQPDLRSMRMQIRMWCMICCVALKKYFRQNSSSTSMQKEIRMHI